MHSMPDLLTKFFKAPTLALILIAIATGASAQSLLVLDYNSAKVFGNVEIAGGAIDITSGAMIVTTSGFGFVPDGYYNGTRRVPYPDEDGQLGAAEYGDAAIHDAILEGANYATGGFWNGTNGIFSSTAGNGSGNTAVGWIDNSIDAYTSFRGVAVTTNQSIIAYTYFGDALLQGSITTSDSTVVTNALGENVGVYGAIGNTVNGQPEGVEWLDGDFNQDGVVNSLDLGLLQSNLGQPALYTAGPFAPGFNPAALQGGEVPEPASPVLLAATATCAIGVHLRWKRLRARESTARRRSS